MNDLSNKDFRQWSPWYEKYVSPLLDIERRKEYFEMLHYMKPPFNPKVEIAEEFMSVIKNDIRFDAELKNFFSFLAACGFFELFKLSFEEWINMTTWYNPGNSGETKEPILKMIKSPQGVQQLKSELRWLPFLQRADGN